MQNSLHFINRFDIIAKRSKLVWLSRQSDSLVMNRSAVRIRPPAPQNPLGIRAGFLFSAGAFLPFANASLPHEKITDFPAGNPGVACSTLPADQMRRFRYSVAQALLTNPPTSSTSSPQGNSRRCPSFDGHLASSPAAPLRVAKMQDVRRAPRSYGTIALLSHFCSAGRLCRFSMIGFLIGHEQNRPVADASMRKNRTLSLSGRRSTCPGRRT